MSVIFDMVEGHVEPDTTPMTEEHESECAPPPREMELAKVHHELSRLAQREARLRAD